MIYCLLIILLVYIIFLGGGGNLLQNNVILWCVRVIAVSAIFILIQFICFVCVLGCKKNSEPFILFLYYCNVVFWGTAVRKEDQSRKGSRRKRREK